MALRRRTINHPFTGPFILLVVGFIMLVIGLGWYWQTKLFLNNAVTTTGTITELQSTGRGYRPVVEFIVPDRKLVQVTLKSSGNPLPFAVGDSVTVYYDPSQPAHAKIDWFINLWFGPMMIGAAGLFCLGIALGLTILFKRILVYRSVVDNRAK